MIKRASVSQIKDYTISKSMGHLVVTMRMYPRFMSKTLVDEYRNSLSPPKELFEKYLELKRKSSDQNKSFEQAGYQQKFKLSDEGLKDLADLVARSKKQDVYMICQCHPDERCHVDLMLLIAENEFGAKIGKLPFEYSEFKARLSSSKVAKV